MDRVMIMFTPEQQERFVEITKAQDKRQVIGLGIEKGFLFLVVRNTATGLTRTVSISPDGSVECGWLGNDD